MADYVSVGNLIAQKLGEDIRLTARTDASHFAVTLDAAWDAQRLIVLRDHPWNCAMKRWSLASRVLEPGETIAPWGYAFPLPPELLRLHEVLEIGNSAANDGYGLGSFSVAPTGSGVSGDWQREQQDILSDGAGPLIIRGNRDVPNVNEWADDLVEAIACRTAFQICLAITGDRSLKNDLWSEYLTAKRDAKSVDGRENPPIPATYDDSSWLTARYDQ